jgi:hypothetical protein
MTELDERYRKYGLDGRMIAATLNTKPTVEDVIRGMSQSNDVQHHLKRLIAVYERSRDKTGLRVGDIVHVKNRYIYLGHQGVRSGWHGYSQMFADEFATLVELEWNIWYGYWSASLSFANPYRYSDYMGGTFFVQEGPTIFQFPVDYIKLVKHADVETEGSDGVR